ncbi:TetR family transcriptional regulator [Nocardia panacis]|nr:TetR family transcriptional regulator [Nocardia panacis]
MSLREHKKRQLRATIADTALRLFVADGFDAVPVVQVAAAAEVSKRTLFKYFPTKEDLVLHRFADHVDDAARIVRDRPQGETPLTALRFAFRTGLDHHEPTTGLCADPAVVACYRLILATPALATRLTHYLTAGEQSLTEALTLDGSRELDARVAACAISAVHRHLSESNWRAIATGSTAVERHPTAVAEADRAFTLLETGFGAVI